MSHHRMSVKKTSENRCNLCSKTCECRVKLLNLASLSLASSGVMNIKVPASRKRSLPEIGGQRNEGTSSLGMAWQNKKAYLHAESTHTCMWVHRCESASSAPYDTSADMKKYKQYKESFAVSRESISGLLKSISIKIRAQLLNVWRNTWQKDQLDLGLTCGSVHGFFCSSIEQMGLSDP